MSCPRTIFGRPACRFEARYDEGAAQLPPNVSRIHDAETLRAFRPKTYVRDVCPRCGRTIEREGK
jgi:hypothetical protein